MQSSQFQDGLASVGRTVGRKDVNVVFGGTQAYTDGKTIHLPALAHDATVNPHQANVIRGFRTHEAIHVRVTDTSTGMWELIQQASLSYPRIKDVTNAIEDVRVEGAAVAEYAGAAIELSALAVESSASQAASLEAVAKQHNVTPEVVVRTMLPPEVQVAHVISSMGRRLVGVAKGIDDPLLNLIDPKWLQFGKAWAEEAARLDNGMRDGSLNEEEGRKGTQASLDLATRLCAAIAEAQQQQPQPPQGEGEGKGEGKDGDSSKPGSKPSKSKGQPGKGEASGQGDGQGEGGEAGEGEGSGAGAGEAGGQGDSSGAGGGEAPGQGGEGGESGSTNISSGAPGGGAGGVSAGGSASAPEMTPEQIEALLEELRSAGESAVESAAGEANSTAAPSPAGEPRVVQADSRTVVWLPLAESLGYKNSCGGFHRYERDIANAKAAESGNASLARTKPGVVDKLLSSTTAEQATIRRILERELQAMKDRRWQSGYESGRLPSHRVVDAMAGVGRAYQQREDGRDMDTLIHLAIDASGSMSGGLMEEAQAMTVALCGALERGGADLEVSTWDGRIANASDSEAVYDKVRQVMASATEGVRIDGAWCVLTEVKGIKDRLSSERVRKALAAMTRLPDGGTPLPQATRAVLQRVAKARHAKKIVIVMSDGQPDDKGMANLLMPNLWKYAEKQGIHLLGVGFGSGASKLNAYFKNYAWAGSGDSYRTVMTQLAKHIAKESRVGRRAA
ncbi:Cobalt chelatase, CobT subunit [uncultured Caudovirales phage]|uniref:Cobalt chelatase, CobT subunit n=1 Tax=uncultured Caudovirales phage TaxID=2100421 RepID=A0A6J5NJV0_9CAUD|nr:Cobalt chelatase, CobT subunit [uncultured Caudovirales phage]